MWALESITTNKTSGGDGIPVELFQILKVDAVKVLTQYVSKFGNLSSGHRTGKGQFSFQSRRKAMPKNVQTTAQLHSSHKQYVNYELPDVQAGFRKGRRIRDQIANICWIIEKARELKKKSTSASLAMPKPLTVWITTNCGKFLDGNTRPPYLFSEKPVCGSRSNS